MTRNDWIHQTAMRILAADPELDADFIASACAEVADEINKKAPFDAVSALAVSRGHAADCPECVSIEAK